MMVFSGIQATLEQKKNCNNLVESSIVLPVTVVIPLYNGASYIKETLESILCQTNKPVEIIIVNDGSTDSSEKIAREYPVRIISQSNKGISSARNAGILAAKSDWIALCDQDDVWFADKLEQQWEILNKFVEIDVLFSDIVILSDGKKYKSKFNVERFVDGASVCELMQNVFKLNSYSVCDTLKHGNIITPSTIVLRKKVAEKYLFDDDMLRAEDLDFFLRVFPSSEVVMLNKPTIYYRLHQGNNSLDTYKMLYGSALLTFKILNNKELYPKMIYDHMFENAFSIFYDVGSLALHNNNYIEAEKFLKLSFNNKPSIKTFIKYVYTAVCLIFKNIRC